MGTAVPIKKRKNRFSFYCCDNKNSGSPVVSYCHLARYENLFFLYRYYKLIDKEYIT
jgi:hypothetical protein